MQSKLCRFVWADKKPRCSQSSLQKHKKVGGGMGFPILRDYFTASLLEQTKFWFQSSSLKHWASIEKYWTSPPPQNFLSSTLLANSFSNTHFKSTYPIIQLVMNTWKQFCFSRNFIAALTDIPTPLSSIQTHIADLSLNTWTKRDYSSYGQESCSI